MTELFAAIIAFIVSHAIPALKPLRARLISLMGFKVYVTLYSLMSIAVLVWLGFAYARAPFIEVWEFREWTRWLTVVLMVPSCLLLTAGLFSPNPLSLTMVKSESYDPVRPGIVGMTRHPVIWAIGLWALAHMPPNGDLASLLMFSLLLLSGLTGPKSLDVKRRAKLGDEEWERLAAGTANLPMLVLVRGQATVKGLKIWTLAAGVVLYVLLYAMHEWLTGLPPLP